MKKIIYMVGVSGCGKSSIGQLLANSLSIPFLDGDDYHPKSNIDKMSQGKPLNDSDREPWLETIQKVAASHKENGCVIACSALKARYRTILSNSLESEVQWVYLKGSFELIYERMQKRKGHFMEAEMLTSQFETLEEPSNALVVDIAMSPNKIVEDILSYIRVD